MRKFTREFKLEAVRLIKERGVSYEQASQNLNVHTSRLRNWLKALPATSSTPFPATAR
jgi:transposase